MSPIACLAPKTPEKSKRPPSNGSLENFSKDKKGLYLLYIMCRTLITAYLRIQIQGIGWRRIMAYLALGVT